MELLVFSLRLCAVLVCCPVALPREDKDVSDPMEIIPSDQVSNSSKYHEQIEFINHFLLRADVYKNATLANSPNPQQIPEVNSYSANIEGTPEKNNTTPNEIPVIPVRSLPAVFSSVIDTLPVHRRVPRRSPVRRRNRVRQTRPGARARPYPVRYLLPPFENQVSESPTTLPPFTTDEPFLSSSSAAPTVPPAREPAPESQRLQIKPEQKESAPSATPPQYRKVFIPPPLRYLLPPFFYENYINAQPSSSQIPPLNKIGSFSPTINVYYSTIKPFCDKNDSSRNDVESSSISPIIVIETVSEGDVDSDIWKSWNRKGGSEGDYSTVPALKHPQTDLDKDVEYINSSKINRYRNQISSTTERILEGFSKLPVRLSNVDRCRIENCEGRSEGENPPVRSERPNPQLASSPSPADNDARYFDAFTNSPFSSVRPNSQLASSSSPADNDARYFDAFTNSPFSSVRPNSQLASSSSPADNDARYIEAFTNSPFSSGSPNSQLVSSTSPVDNDARSIDAFTTNPFNSGRRQNSQFASSTSPVDNDARSIDAFTTNPFNSGRRQNSQFASSTSPVDNDARSIDAFTTNPFNSGRRQNSQFASSTSPVDNDARSIDAFTTNPFNSGLRQNSQFASSTSPVDNDARSIDAFTTNPFNSGRRQNSQLASSTSPVDNDARSIDAFTTNPFNSGRRQNSRFASSTSPVDNDARSIDAFTTNPFNSGRRQNSQFASSTSPVDNDARSIDAFTTTPFNSGRRQNSQFASSTSPVDNDARSIDAFTTTPFNSGRRQNSQFASSTSPVDNDARSIDAFTTTPFNSGRRQNSRFASSTSPVDNDARSIDAFTTTPFNSGRRQNPQLVSSTSPVDNDARSIDAFTTTPFQSFPSKTTTSASSASATAFPVLRGPNLEQVLFETGDFQIVDASLNDSMDSTVAMMDRPLLAQEVALAGMKITANLKEDRMRKVNVNRGNFKFSHLNQFNFQGASGYSEGSSKTSRLEVAESSYYKDRRASKYPTQEIDLRVIPGRPGKDYPTLSSPPSGSDFSCRSVGYHRGYVADPATNCQVFYICVGDGPGEPMLCPNGTLFSQDFLVCDWWYNIDCRPLS